MKILQTPARFYPYRGGTEQLVYCLSRELVRSGNSVSVICADEPACGDGVIEGIKVRRLKYPFKIANTNITPGLLSALMQEDFDVLHTHLPHPWSADISVAAASMRKKPLFLTYHNDITAKGWLKPVAGAYNSSLLKVLLHAARAIFITSAGYVDKSEFLRPFRKKIVVSSPGVDTDRFRPLPGAQRLENSIFFLSLLDRFHAYKGLDVLLLALEEVRRKRAVKLYVGGSGELLEHYQRSVFSSGIGDSVVFLGKLDDGQVLHYYNSCDMFVLPSVSQIQEGFGLVALEAMACRRPVVVSDVVGLADDIKLCEAGLVVKPGNVTELARAIEFLIDNASARQQMGQNGYHLALENYSWEKHAKVVLAQYKRA